MALSIAGLIAGCGSGDGEADVSAQAEDAVPSDLAVSFVVAGDGAGWVAGVGGDRDEVRLWRLAADGGATEVTRLPDLVSMDSAAIDGQLAVAGLRCIEGGVDDLAEGCGASVAEVLLIDDAGEITNLTLFEDDTGLDDGDGLGIAGSTGDSVWISTERGLFEVSADGSVVQELPDATGGECVIDGSLYRFVSPERGAASTEGSSPPVTTVDPTQQAADSRSLEIERLDGGTFTPVPGGGRTLDGAGYVDLRCTNSALEAADANGVLTDRWTPTEGWQATRGVAAPPTVVPTTSSGTFALNTDGTVLERGPDGAFTPTGIRLPDLGEAGQIPPSLTVDRSPSTVVACTTRSTSQTDTKTVCQTAPAG